MTEVKIAKFTVLVMLAGMGGCIEEQPCNRTTIFACDITVANCQRRVFEFAQCARGSFDTEMPVTRVLTRDALAAEIESRDEPMMMDVIRGPLDFDDPVIAFALREMGLVSPDAAAAESAFLDTIGGVFFPDTRDVVIVEDGPTTDPRTLTSILAHEYVHSMQPILAPEAREAVYDSSDHVFRALAGVEGEALFHQIDVLLWFNGERLRDYLPPLADGRTVEPLYRDIAEGLRAASARLPSPLLAAQPLRYELGLRFVTRQFVSGGLEGLRDWPASLPASSADLFELVETRIADLPYVDLPARAEATCQVDGPAALTLVADDSLGAAYVYTFLYAHGLNEASAETGARALHADRIAIYESPDGGVATAWRLQLVDAVDAHRLRNDLADQGTFTVDALDDALVIRAASDPAIFDEWPLTCR